MSPKPAHVTAAESVVDQLDLFTNPGFVREFGTPAGVDWEQLADALLDRDTATPTARECVLELPTGDRGLLLFAADLALDRYRVDQWDNVNHARARVALRVAAGRPARSSEGHVNVVTGGNTGTLIQAGSIYGGFNL